MRGLGEQRGGRGLRPKSAYSSGSQRRIARRWAGAGKPVEEDGWIGADEWCTHMVGARAPAAFVAHSSSGLGRRPLKAETTGSNPVWVTSHVRRRAERGAVVVPASAVLDDLPPGLIGKIVKSISVRTFVGLAKGVSAA